MFSDCFLQHHASFLRKANSVKCPVIFFCFGSHSSVSVICGGYYSWFRCWCNFIPCSGFFLAFSVSFLMTLTVCGTSGNMIFFFNQSLSWKLTCWNLILSWHPTSSFCISLCLRFSYTSSIQACLENTISVT